MTTTADRMSTAAVEAAMAPLSRTEPTVGDVRRMLRTLAKHQDIHDLIDALVPEGGNPEVREARALGVVQAMCWQAEHVLARLHPAVQDAPLAGLNEVVSEASVRCLSPRCAEWRYPWQDECCDGTCRSEYAAATGDTHADIFS
jgi:hypothetical protein